MKTEFDSNELKKSFKTMKLISFVLFGLILFTSFYAATIFSSIQSNADKLNSADELNIEEGNYSDFTMFRIVFFIIVLSDFFVLNFMKNKILSRKSTVEENGQQDVSMEAITKLKSTTLITIPMAVTPAIFGLVLFILSQNIFDFIGFFIISLIAFYINFPRYEKWEEYVKKQLSEKNY